MPQLDEIHEVLSKPSLFDKLKERTGGEAQQLLDKGKVTYMAKKTYDTLPHDVRAALPKPLQEKLSSVVWPAFTAMLEQMDKRAGIVGQTLGRAAGAVKANPLAATEVGGLGVLAVPGLDTMQAHVRARIAGDKGPNAVEKRQFMGEGGHAVADVAGLGILAHPELKHLLGKHAAFNNTAYAGNIAQNPPGMRGHSKLAPFVAPELEKKSGALKRVGELVTGSKAKALSSAAAEHGAAAVATIKNRVTPEGAKDTGDILKHLQSTSASAGRERRAAGRIGTLAAKEKNKVNEVRGMAGAVAAGSTAAALRLKKKEAGVGVGSSMTASQYSGPLSLGRFKMTSPAPGFTSPEMESKKEASAFVDEFLKLWKEAGGMNTATGAQHAEGKLHATSSVGAPKMTPPPGPSIAQVAKPKGFGMPLAGAKKGLL